MSESPPLRGREAELAVAGDLLRAVAAGAGAVLAIVGEAGIGKTALVAEIYERAAAAGFAAGRGTAQEHGEIAPLTPLLVALRSGRAPLLAADDFGALAAYAERGFWLVDRLAVELRRRTAAQPLLICVEDVQWADPLTRHALRVLPGQAGILWVTTGRAEAGPVPSRRLALPALNTAVLGEIAADRLGAPAGPALRALIAGAGGNPGLVVSLVTGLLAEQRPASGVMPDRLVRDVRARLRPLPAGTRALLHAAALLAATFTVDQIAAVLNGPPERVVLPWLDPAVRDGVLEDLGDHLRFRHDLLRRAVRAGGRPH